MRLSCPQYPNYVHYVKYLTSSINMTKAPRELNCKCNTLLEISCEKLGRSLAERKCCSWIMFLFRASLTWSFKTNRPINPAVAILQTEHITITYTTRHPHATDRHNITRYHTCRRPSPRPGRASNAHGQPRQPNDAPTRQTNPAHAVRFVVLTS